MSKKAKRTEKSCNTEFTCGDCGHTFVKEVAGGEGVSCPDCGSSDQLSSRPVKGAAATKDDEAGNDDKDQGGE